MTKPKAIQPPPMPIKKISKALDQSSQINAKVIRQARPSTAA